MSDFQRIIISKLRILRLDNGFYLGRIYATETGFECAYDRQSSYYYTKEQAHEDLVMIVEDAYLPGAEFNVDIYLGTEAPKFEVEGECARFQEPYALILVTKEDVMKAICDFANQEQVELHKLLDYTRVTLLAEKYDVDMNLLRMFPNENREGVLKGRKMIYHFSK